MLADGRRVPAGAELHADVCIVGAGPAGITLARRLAAARLDVVLLESGGLEEEPDAQALNRGTNVGHPYFALDQTDFRVLGGASNRWGGWCRPLDPLDLEHRPWVPDSGWPLRHDELSPFYEEAAALCELPRQDFSPAGWGEAVPPLYRPPFVGGEVRTVVWQGSAPTKFGTLYRRELQQAANVRVLLHATVAELETTDDGGHVTAARVVPPAGGAFSVRARTFVVAAGAIHTARLLLASNRARPAGLGNGHDLVGRYFMEHPHVPSGRLILDERGRRPALPALDRGLSGAWHRFSLQRPSGGIKCAYALTEDVLRERELLNYSVHLAVGNAEARAGSETYQALRLVAGNLRNPAALLRQATSGSLPEGVGTQVQRLVRNPGEVADVVAGELLRQPRELELFTQSEQRPNRDSRVTVDSRDRDAAGMPRPILDWRLTDQDRTSILDAQRVVGSQLERAGLGRVEPAEWLVAGDRWSPAMHGGHHHLGTARMHASEAHGVVDVHLRVHEVANLYVGDGSVFPTGGFANPMLTIVALALRLGGHLAREAPRAPAG